MSWEIRQGDALERLREMPDESVQCCVTSPPFFGLRDYGTATWEGGDEGCDHTGTRLVSDKSGLRNDGREHVGPYDGEKKVSTGMPYRDECGQCGAKRIDSQLGLEPTPQEYVEKLVAVFREVRRVLRDDGTLWLNLGDSYNAYNGNAGPASGIDSPTGARSTQRPKLATGHGKCVKALKPKDLLGIPWMVAFALRDAGWYLRSEIIWNKPNPMPESVRDRPTRAHEQIFLFSKRPRYFYDAEAVREEVSPLSREVHSRYKQAGTWTPKEGASENYRGRENGLGRDLDAGRNKRSVWTISTKPYAEAHFATFPPDLVEPCILAGSSPQACGECGAPWERVVEEQADNREGRDGAATKAAAQGPTGAARVIDANGWNLPTKDRQTVGWQPTCSHSDDSGRSVVLDPFAGAGTTGVVALRHDRSFIGIELNPDYCELARERIRQDGPLFNVASETAA